jgi:uncharacterized damage-inducible protein DinB
VNDLLLNLIAHMRWADATFADALARDATAADAVSVFAHIASVEHLWFARIQGQPPRYAVWPSLAVSESRALAAEHADLFASLVAASTGDALERPVRYRNSAGREYVNSILDIVTHVAMHGTHHRGQLARIIRASGQEPPYTDYIQFARRDQPG